MVRHVSRSTVLRLARTNALAHVRVRHALRFEDEAIDAFIEARRSRPMQAPAVLAVATLPTVRTRRFA